MTEHFWQTGIDKRICPLGPLHWAKLGGRGAPACGARSIHDHARVRYVLRVTYNQDSVTCPRCRHIASLRVVPNRKGEKP
jgi:hypothetical protein